MCHVKTGNQNTFCDCLSTLVESEGYQKKEDYFFSALLSNLWAKPANGKMLPKKTEGFFTINKNVKIVIPEKACSVAPVFRLPVQDNAVVQ